MAIFECKGCGGMLEAKDNEAVVVCRACGAANSVPGWNNEPSQAEKPDDAAKPIDASQTDTVHTDENYAPNTPSTDAEAQAAPQTQEAQPQFAETQDPYANQQNPYGNFYNPYMAPQNPYANPYAAQQGQNPYANPYQQQGQNPYANPYQQQGQTPYADPYQQQGQNPYANPYMPQQGQNPYANPYMPQQGQHPYANPYMTQPAQPEEETHATDATPEQLTAEGFEALGAGDVRKAFNLFNKAQKADPQNVQASLGKLLLELHVTGVDDVAASANVAFDNSPNYRNILMSDDEELKAKLSAALEAVHERLAKAADEAQKEAAYATACKLMAKPSSSNFEKAIHIFENILEYKDSAPRLEACANQIEGLRRKEAEMRAAKARKNELMRQDAEQKKKWIMWGCIGGGALVIIVTMLILTFTVFVPNSKYSKAEKLYEEGDLFGAYEIVTELGSKKANKLAAKIGEDILNDFQEALDNNDCQEAYDILTSFGYTGKDFPLLDGYKAMAEGRYKDAIELGMPEILVQKGTKEITAAQFSGITKEFMVVLPEGLTTIGDNAFSGSSVVSVTMPDSVTSIGDGAFKDCKSLTSLTLSNGVTSIGDGTFSGSGISKITLPKNITSIGDEAFKNCTKLSAIDIPKSVTSIGDSAFAATSLKKVTLHGDIESVGKYAFETCPALSSVTIDDGVKSLGEGVFRGCEALKSISVPGSITKIPKEAFMGCEKLADVVIARGVTTIGDSAFNGCEALTDITIPSSVTTIGEQAFKSCDGFKELTIPSSVTSLGAEAFRDCDGVRTVTIPSTIATVPEGLFMNCDLLTTINFGSGVTAIGAKAFSGCGSLKSITLPSTITSIGDEAFSKCASLGSITIPTSVKKIGASFIAESTNLSFIQYEGTDKQWEQIDKNVNWQKNARSSLYVYGSNGIIVKPTT